MKIFYFCLFVFSVLLLPLSIPPVSSTLSPIERLAIKPKLWTLQINEGGAEYFKMGTTELQASLVDSLKRKGSARDLTFTWMLLVSVLFSFLGWRREAYLQKNALSEIIKRSR